MTERTVARFAEAATLIWRHDDDFDVWMIDRVTPDAVVLARSDIETPARRYRSPADGHALV